MKAVGRAVGFVSQLQNRVSQLQVSDLDAAGRLVLKVFLKAEMFFVEFDRTNEIADVERDVIDSPKH
jgi:hypothetical protein